MSSPPTTSTTPARATGPSARARIGLGCLTLIAVAALVAGVYNTWTTGSWRQLYPIPFALGILIPLVRNWTRNR